MPFVFDPEAQTFQPLSAVQNELEALLAGSLIGWGCFETLYWNGTRLEGLFEHMRLLARSAEFLGISGLPDLDRLGQAVSGLLQGAQEMPVPARVRVTLSATPPHLLSTGSDRAEVCACIVSVLSCPDARSDKPLSLVTSDIRRNETSPLSQIKSINYADNLLARRQAGEQGAGEALMLNMRDRIACLAMGNLIAIKKQEPPIVCTPPPDEGARPGYMRATAIRAAQELGWKMLETPLLPEDLTRMRAVLACNSLWGVRAVRRLDGACLPEDPELAMKFRQVCLAICAV